MTRHQDSIIIKRCIFEFFSYFTDLFFLGFIKRDIQALKESLSSLFICDSIRRILTETVLPYLMNKSKQMLSRTAGSWENYLNAKLDEVTKYPAYSQFDDYIEIIMNFGHLTMFASAFTLAPALILLFTLLEKVSDLFKLCYIYQRPVPSKVQGIGSWNQVLFIMNVLSVITNLILFAFVSDQIVEFLPWIFEEDQPKAPGNARPAPQLTPAPAHARPSRRGTYRPLALLSGRQPRTLKMLTLLLRPRACE